MKRTMLVKYLKTLLLYLVILKLILIIVIIHFNYPVLDTNQKDLKYILVWSSSEWLPFKLLAVGQGWFINKQCSVTKCYAVADKTFLRNIEDFDVVLFNAPDLYHEKLPKHRSQHQKYVFLSMESADNYPLCKSKTWNGYFNLTMTYKLNSDVYFGFVLIRNKEGEVIGPKKEMHWMDVKSMEPITDELKAKLSTKRIAAAWFVSNCNDNSDRHLIAEDLQAELAKYHMTLDIYGACGTKQCPISNMEECLRKLETDYYFYLSFENSFSEDYVTEKLMHALQHYTVPIVYGDANYTRFMPHGIYLNALKLDVRKLAEEIAESIRNKEKYYSYFKWHNHYSYHYQDDLADTEAFCKLCELINNEEYFNRKTVIENFNKWWDPPSYKCS